MYDQLVDCYVDHPITNGEWNKISLEFGDGYVVTSANGIRHRVQFETGEASDDGVLFDDWYIGENNVGVEGIGGTIDKFEVANLDIDENSPRSGEIPTWVLGTLVGGVGVALLLVGCVFYRCYGKGKWCAPELNEHLDTKGDLPQAPDASDSFTGDEVRPIGVIQAGPHNANLSNKLDVNGPAPKKKGGKKKKAPGRGAPPPPPPNRTSSRGLNLGLSAAQRRDSWQI